MTDYLTIGCHIIYKIDFIDVKGYIFTVYVYLVHFIVLWMKIDGLQIKNSINVRTLYKR